MGYCPGLALRRIAIETKRLVIIAAICLFGQSSAATAQTSGSTPSFHLEKSTISKGAPVLVDVDIDNPSSQAIDIDLGGNGNENLEIFVVTPTGHRVGRVPPDRQNGETFFGKVHLEPGRTYREALVLNEWFDFSETGKYAIEIGLRSANRPAAILHLEVTAKDNAELAMTCSELVSRIETTTSAQDSLAAAQALAYIRDPVAVSAWEELLHRPDLETAAIDNLTAIGDAHAADVLISRLTVSDDGTRKSVQSGLQLIANRTADEVTRQKIVEALRVQK